MIFTFFALIIFFGVLFIFGWQIARIILDEKRIEALIPLAAILGISIYLFFLIFFSYLINIQINFYLLLVLFAFLSYFLSRINGKKEKSEWGIGNLWRKILFISCFLIITLVGINGLRDVQSDQMFPDHLPLGATIAEGNFPIKAIYAPNFPSQSHDGANLFLAAITKVTNLPIQFGHDLHNCIFTALLFLFGFLLIKDFFKDNFRAYLASLVMICGGNLYFIYVAEGISSLYQKFILHLPVEAPFRFLNDMIFGKDILRGGLVVHCSQIAWKTLGFALIIAIIYLYFRAIDDRKNWFKISLIAGMMFSLLALSAELFFGPLLAVLLFYPLVFVILKKDRERGKLYLKTSFLILFLGSILAVLQGGILTETVKQIFFGYSLPLDYTLAITPQYLLKGLIFSDDGVFIPIFSPVVFLAWGWMIIFIIPASIYFLKKSFRLGSFLLLLIFVSFFTPLILTAGISQGDMMRTNYLTALFWNLIFGVFLGWLVLLFRKKWQRLLIIILISGAIYQGLSYFILFAAFPALELGRPLVGEQVPQPNPVEIETFNWIDKNTTIKDYFLTFGAEPLGVFDNARFVVLTGRFAPGFFYGADVQTTNKRYLNLKTLKSEQFWYERILKECDPLALKILNYRYLYVNEYWPVGLEEKCLTGNNLDLKFEFREGNNFARIYKVLDD